MSLNGEELSFFRENGFVQLSGLVSTELVERAKRAINISVGQGMDPKDMPRLRVQSFCPELREDPALMGLLSDSEIWETGQFLIGENKVRAGSQGAAQINLRFPVEKHSSFYLEPHLDGMASRTNAVPSGQLRNFTALVGVMLSDLPGEFRGNFTVWPGTHLLNADYLRVHEPKSLLSKMPEIKLPNPLQVMGKAGDVIFAHYLLSHGTAPNWSCDIRYMVFFRLTHIEHEKQQWDSLTDPWLQWDALRPTVAL